MKKNQGLFEVRWRVRWGGGSSPCDPKPNVTATLPPEPPAQTSELQQTRLFTEHHTGERGNCPTWEFSHQLERRAQEPCGVAQQLAGDSQTLRIGRKTMSKSNRCNFIRSGNQSKVNPIVRIGIIDFICLGSGDLKVT